MKKIILSAVFISVTMAVTFQAGAEDAKKVAAKKSGAFFERLDTDKNGEVSSSEHAAFFAARFKETDKNSDGKVTKEEMKTARDEFREERLRQRAERNKANETKAGSSN